MSSWQVTQCSESAYVVNIRGAKVALYLALTKPELLQAIISLENAPISSKLSPTFKGYVEAMQAITDAKFTKRKEAEDFLAKYEEVFSRQFLLISGQGRSTVPFDEFTTYIPFDFSRTT
jgi:hypothetical protein